MLSNHNAKGGIACHLRPLLRRYVWADGNHAERPAICWRELNRLRSSSPTAN